MYENKGCLQQKKRQLILKTPIWLYSKYRCNEKSFFYENAPENVPEIENSGLYFQLHFVLGLQKIGTLQKFLFPGFFPEIFSGDFLT